MEKRYLVRATAPRGFPVLYPRHKRDYSHDEAQQTADRLKAEGFTDVEIEEYFPTGIIA